MPETQDYTTVTIQHCCGHFVTYEIPEPRRVFHRSDAQIAQHYCEPCKTLPLHLKQMQATCEDLGDSYQIAFIQGSYPFRDILVARGYEFIPKFYRTKRGANVLNCTPEEGAVEMEWIRQNGWTISMVN